MTAEQIKASVAGAVEYLNAHPEEARYTDPPVTAVLESGLRFSADAGGQTITTDMPASIGGGAAGPSPGVYYRASLATCLGTLIALRAAVEGLAVQRLEVTIDSESDDRGILGADPAIAAGPFSVRARVSIETSDDTRVPAILEWARVHCPVTEALGRAVPLSVETT